MSVDPYVAPNTRVADPTSGDTASSALLVRCWRGEARLWQAFWLVLVLGYVAANAISFLVLLTANRLGSSVVVAIAVGITVLVNFTVLAFALASVWRCAPNTRFLTLKSLSRALVIGVAAVLAMQLIQGIQQGWRMIEDRRQQHSSEWPSNIASQGRSYEGAALAVAAP